MTRRFRGVITGTALAVAVVLAPAAEPVAQAEGSAPLQQLIVHDPLMHGVPLPTSSLNSLVFGLYEYEKTAMTQMGGSASVAAYGWHEPNASRKLVVVVLVGLSDPRLNSRDMSKQTALAAQSAAATICAGAIATPPKLDEKVRGIPNSHYIQCPKAPKNVVLDGVTTSRSNIFVMILSSLETMSRSRLQLLAKRQYDDLPALGLPSASTLT